MLRACMSGTRAIPDVSRMFDNEKKGQQAAR
jgi:hypothetical protein